MTITRLIFFLFSILLAETAFAGKSAQRPLVLVSVYPIHAMVQEVAADSFEVKPALPYGRSEHDYEASAKDIRVLRSANLLLIVDKTTDGWMAQAAGNRVPVFEILPHVGAATYGETVGVAALGTSAAQAMSRQADPHFWTDPVRMGKAAIAVAHRLAEMTDADGATRKAVLERAQIFAARMARLSESIVAQSKSLPNVSLILAHGSLGYYCRLSGLKIIGILEPVPHVEPTPRHLGILIKLAKTHRPSVVLAEEQIDAAVAQALAREAGVAVARINPLGYPEAATAVSIGAYDRYLTRFISEVAKGLTEK